MTEATKREQLNKEAHKLLDDILGYRRAAETAMHDTSGYAVAEGQARDALEKVIAKYAKAIR